jgi:hypothetical protein
LRHAATKVEVLTGKEITKENQDASTSSSVFQHRARDLRRDRARRGALIIYNTFSIVVGQRA